MDLHQPLPPMDLDMGNHSVLEWLYTEAEEILMDTPLPLVSSNTTSIPVNLTDVLIDTTFDVDEPRSCTFHSAANVDVVPRQYCSVVDDQPQQPSYIQDVQIFDDYDMAGWSFLNLDDYYIPMTHHGHNPVPATPNVSLHDQQQFTMVEASDLLLQDGRSPCMPPGAEAAATDTVVVRDGGGDVPNYCRRWSGAAGPGRAAKSSSIGFEEISKYFYMTITDAAKEMRVGLTVLKKRCRELGISRWPHRKMKSLRSLIHNVQELGKGSGDVNIQREIESLQENKKLMEKMPELELSERTKKLRQACFKANYKKRRATQTPPHLDTCNNRAFRL